MWKRSCPNCNTEIPYSNRCNWNRGNRTNALCYNCANETRKGRKRTEEQRKLISEKTKMAMDNPVVIEKIKMEMSKPEVKQKMSENCRRQMSLLKQNKTEFDKFKKLQSEIKKDYWNSINDETKQFHLNSLETGRYIRWNNPNSRKHMSEKMTGDKNHFYGKKHSEETIEKLRKATTERLIKFWNDGGLHGINTVPEIKIKNILKKHNIEFISPFVLENKIFDLYIPKNNLIIEVDGCYWHSKNVKLDDMDEQQSRRWKNDRYKDNLANKKGYKLMRIWEDEINVTDVLERIYNV
jgi:very-short-patch-repair endonuclease